MFYRLLRLCIWGPFCFAVYLLLALAAAVLTAISMLMADFNKKLLDRYFLLINRLWFTHHVIEYVEKR